MKEMAPRCFECGRRETNRDGVDSILLKAFSYNLSQRALYKVDRALLNTNSEILFRRMTAVSVERVDCRAGGRRFDSWGRTNTQGLKITAK